MLRLPPDVAVKRTVEPELGGLEAPPAPPPPPAPLPDAPRSAPTPAPRGRGPRALLGTWFGRAALGLAVAGVIAGSHLAHTRGPAVSPTPIELREDAPPRGQSVRTVGRVLEEGFRAVAPGVSPDVLLERVRAVSFAVRIERGHLLGPLEIPPGTRLSVSLSPGGLSVHANPAIVWRAEWAPDPSIEHLYYDFSTGRFRAQATGLGPDSWYEESIEAGANEHLAARFPRAMRQPGYNPFTDPHLADNVQRLIDALTDTQDPETRAPRVTDLSRLTSPEVILDLDLGPARTVALPDGRHSAWIEAGTRASLSLTTRGRVDDPVLSGMRLQFNRPVRIAPGTEEPGAFQRIDLSAASLRPNGQLELEYEIGAEQMVDGLRGLFILGAILLDPRVATQGNLNIEPTRLEAARARIQAEVDQTLEPELAEVIRRHDQAISGVSLVRFFGLR